MRGGGCYGDAPARRTGRGGLHREQRERKRGKDLNGKRRGGWGGPHNTEYLPVRLGTLHPHLIIHVAQESTSLPRFPTPKATFSILGLFLTLSQLLLNRPLDPFRQQYWAVDSSAYHYRYR